MNLLSQAVIKALPAETRTFFSLLPVALDLCRRGELPKTALTGELMDVAQRKLGGSLILSFDGLPAGIEDAFSSIKAIAQDAIISRPGIAADQKTGSDYHVIVPASPRQEAVRRFLAVAHGMGDVNVKRALVL